jgi:hypothetical protein
MFPRSRNFLKFAAGGAFLALSAVAHTPYAAALIAPYLTSPASAGEIWPQRLGSVGPHEPLLATVGNKRVLAFFIPGNDQCNVQAVIWNADDMEATTAGRVRVSLNPGQTASIDSSATETFTILCGDRAETLVSVDPNPDPQVASE